MLLGVYAFHWPFVVSDKEKWVSEAWVPSICKDEMPCRPASGTVDCAEALLNHGLPRLAHKHYPAACRVMEAALTIRATQWLGPDMAAGDCSSSL